MNLFIKQLTKKEISTVRGPATKLTIVDENGKFYGGFLAPFNQQWVEGQTLTEGKDYLVKSRDFNGKTYYDLISPTSSAKANNSVATTELLALIVSVGNKLDVIDKKLDALASKFVQNKEQIDVETLPF